MLGHFNSTTPGDNVCHPDSGMHPGLVLTKAVNIVLDMRCAVSCAPPHPAARSCVQVQTVTAKLTGGLRSGTGWSVHPPGTSANHRRLPHMNWCACSSNPTRRQSTTSLAGMNTHRQGSGQPHVMRSSLTAYIQDHHREAAAAAVSGRAGGPLQLVTSGCPQRYGSSSP